MPVKGLHLYCMYHHINSFNSHKKRMFQRSISPDSSGQDEQVRIVGVGRFSESDMDQFYIRGQTDQYHIKSRDLPNVFTETSSEQVGI